MGIRPEFRWWLLTLAVVALLLGISALALDRPDVAWARGRPLCPHCRSAVPSFASRCAHCREQFDWVAAAEEESPLSPWSLSALEVEWARDRIEVVGPEEAARRVGQALSLPEGVAARYLAALGQGRCGWCGGTGVEPASSTPVRDVPCSVCLGRSLCIACGGDRRIRVGDLAARRALRAYARDLLDVAAALPVPRQHEEARRLGEAFLARHAGTVEATWIVFAPRWEAGRLPDLASPDTLADDIDRATRSEGPAPGLRAVEAARERLDRVFLALGAE